MNKAAIAVTVTALLVLYVTQRRAAVKPLRMAQVNATPIFTSYHDGQYTFVIRLENKTDKPISVRHPLVSLAPITQVRVGGELIKVPAYTATHVLVNIQGDAPSQPGAATIYMDWGLPFLGATLKPSQQPIQVKVADNAKVSLANFPNVSLEQLSA